MAVCSQWKTSQTVTKSTSTIIHMKISDFKIVWPVGRIKTDLEIDEILCVHRILLRILCLEKGGVYLCVSDTEAEVSMVNILVNLEELHQITPH